ncbi:uncharacterized protein CDV56_102067 [Aspergillus thermomutatus]|uniref:Cytochrome P450 n=1 Tax=Aspergillus thermomutatus TaxID=41047 RepID=A0A397GMZ1_ASPTH|nr:uncharacterized protein CDV56_102067 [Aspergillus thermomutatus]RHZ50904.1 hypothetical protein CDV56_102067 [Aspergillus thermomutatus]
MTMKGDGMVIAYPFRWSWGPSEDILYLEWIRRCWHPAASPAQPNGNSGIAPNPLPGTDVPLELRVHHHQQQAAHRFLTGDALQRMTERFMSFLSEEIDGDNRIRTYTEVLRMRIAWMLNRTPTQVDVCTNVAACDPGAWGPERTQNGKYPLDQFWAERFLVRGDEKTGPKYSLDGLSGGFIAYGGGPYMCPGRHFAKQEIRGSVAVFKAYYELEIVDRPRGWLPKVNRNFMALGPCLLANRFPFAFGERVHSK